MHRLAALIGVVLAMLLPASALADAQYRLLVFATPSKYHYEYIPIARDSIERLAKLHAFEFDWTHKPEAFDVDLSRYAAIMFLNTPLEALTLAQRGRIEAYMRGGGNAIVVHRAAIIPPDAWPWYERLVGRRVGVHPMLQTGVVTVKDRGFPAAFALPDRWVWSDEFYTTTNPHGVRIHTVLGVDEASYDPRKIWPGQRSEPMGPDHPIAWTHAYEKGRVFVTTLGHNGEMYRDPRYMDHLMGGIYWAATGLGEAGRPTP